MNERHFSHPLRHKTSATTVTSIHNINFIVLFHLIRIRMLLVVLQAKKKEKGNEELKKEWQLNAD